MTKILSCCISQEPYIIWLSFMVHLWKMIISPGVFFFFFKILIFWVVRGVKRQKMAQNEKKLCLSCSISQESYTIWFSFMVHLCKMIIFPRVFFFFSKFWFSGLLKGVKGQKIVQSVKNSVCCAPYLRDHTLYDHHLWFASVKWWYLQAFFSCFSKFWFFRFLGGSKGKKWPNMTKKIVRHTFISQEPYIMWSSFMIRMCKRIILSGFFYIFSKF